MIASIRLGQERTELKTQANMLPYYDDNTCGNESKAKYTHSNIHFKYTLSDKYNRHIEKHIKHSTSPFIFECSQKNQHASYAFLKCTYWQKEMKCCFSGGGSGLFEYFYFQD